MRKIYRVLRDLRSQEHHLLRVVDESGEDYLYPENFFAPVSLSKPVERAQYLKKFKPDFWRKPTSERVQRASFQLSDEAASLFLVTKPGRGDVKELDLLTEARIRDASLHEVNALCNDKIRSIVRDICACTDNGYGASKVMGEHVDVEMSTFVI